MKTYAKEAFLTLSKEETIIGLTGGITPDPVMDMVHKRRWLVWEKRINPRSGKAKKYIIVTDPYKEDRATGEPRLKLIIDEILRENLTVNNKKWDEIEFIPYCEEMVYDEESLPHRTEGVNTQLAEDDGKPRVVHNPPEETPEEPEWFQRVEEKPPLRTEPVRPDQNALIVGVMGILSDFKRAKTLKEVRELGDSLYESVKDIYDYHTERVCT